MASFQKGKGCWLMISFGQMLCWTHCCTKFGSHFTVHFFYPFGMYCQKLVFSVRWILREIYTYIIFKSFVWNLSGYMKIQLLNQNKFLCFCKKTAPEKLTKSLLLLGCVNQSFCYWVCTQKIPITNELSTFVVELNWISVLATLH